MSYPFLLLAQSEADVAASLDDLGNVPYWVLAGYLLLLLVLGTYGWLKSKTGEEDYYLAGRKQGWLISSLTIMATFFSSFALLGAPGMVYREGVVFALFSLNVPVAGLSVYLLGSRIWKLGHRFGYVTPGDLIADYYGSRVSLRLLVALAGFLYAIPYVVMQIQAGGIISQKLFGEESFATGAVLLAAITMLYIMIGGMRSVAWTDLVQGLLLISGMLVGGFAMFLVFGGPGNFGRRVLTELPESSLTAPGNTGMWPWTMVLTVCLLGSTGSMVQPAQWMRYYSASGVRTLQRGAVIFALVLTSCFILGVMLIGLAGQVLYPLSFQVSLPVADGPQRLEEEVPAQFRENFQYIPPAPESEKRDGTLAWQWTGRLTQPLTEQDAERLAALSDNPSYQEAVRQLPQEMAPDGRRPDVLPNPHVDPDPSDRRDFDSILVVVLNEQLPRVLGPIGALFVSLMVVAIMAASMSTADSNLHALAAVLTRDVYDQYIRPSASERERVWTGRAIILVATVSALAIVISGRNPGVSSKYDFMNMIAQMGLMAIAFSAQLLPITVDILFLRKGTSRGAALGLAAGLLGAFVFGPLFVMLSERLGAPQPLETVQLYVGALKKTVPVHGSVWGLLFNVPVFVIVSWLTAQVPAERRERFAAAMR